jgi:hypothetical protein
MDPANSETVGAVLVGESTAGRDDPGHPCVVEPMEPGPQSPFSWGRTVAGALERLVLPVAINESLTQHAGSGTIFFHVSATESAVRRLQR